MGCKVCLYCGLAIYDSFRIVADNQSFEGLPPIITKEITIITAIPLNFTHWP